MTRPTRKTPSQPAASRLLNDPLDWLAASGAAEPAPIDAAPARPAVKQKRTAKMTTAPSDPRPAAAATAAASRSSGDLSPEASAALEMLKTPVLVADAAMVIRFANTSALRMFTAIEADLQAEMPDFSASQIVGKSVDHFHRKPEHQRRLMDSVQSSFDGRFVMGGKTIRFVTSPLCDAEGRMQHIVVELRDSTEEDEARRQLDAMLEDLGAVSDAHLHGATEVRMEPERYGQTLGLLAGRINSMLGNYLHVMETSVSCVEAFGNGDLEAELPSFPGQLAGINTAMERVRANLLAARTAEEQSRASIDRLLAEVAAMSAAHVAGDVDVRMNAAAYPHDLGLVAEALNEMVQTQVDSVEEAIGCFAAIGEGNFDAPMRQWPGKKAIVNRVIERFRANMRAVTAEIAMMSDSIVEGRLDREVDLSKFSGDFVGIVQSFERTYASLNGVFHSLSVQLAQTGETVTQVSQASQALATNSAVQSSSVDEVSASAEETDSQVKANAASARSASVLVDGAASVAAEGKDKITEMVHAMEGIRVSSQGIAKIIKVIDEIAFQTNLLALNAAVEAARAGQHGRGFAVVAHEVRNLAGRSAKAARETSDLIEDAGTRVQAGVRIANETSRSFVSIVDDIEKVKLLVREIAVASDEQTRGVAQINGAIGEVAKSALATSQQADELASSATQLQAATESMTTEVGRFKLRKPRKPKAELPSLDALSPEMLAQLQQMVAVQMGLASHDKGLLPPAVPAGGKAYTNGHSSRSTDRDERGFGDF